MRALRRAVIRALYHVTYHLNINVPYIGSNVNEDHKGHTVALFRIS